MENVSKNEMVNIIENNYGSIYKTTGGGKTQMAGVNVKSWVKKILGNRLFDLYVKYLGVKTLTTATLVPLSLILSKDMFENFLKNKKEQVGGVIPKDIPILDNKLVGLYLKLAGLSLLDLSTSTLLPLGAIMIIYDLSIKNQIGGLANPPFNYNNLSGGGKLLTGSYIPPGPIQKIHSYFHGDRMPEPLLHMERRDPVNNENLQLSCMRGDCSAGSSAFIFPESSSAIGFDSLNIESSSNEGTSSADIKSSVSEQPYHASLELSAPQSMAGGAKFNELKFDKEVERCIPRKGNVMNIPRRKNKNEYPYFDKVIAVTAHECEHQQKGGGSDWMATQYSAGPANSPKMSNYQFRMFNKTNMNNAQFAKQYQKVPTELLVDTPLYRQYHNETGVPTSQYGSSLEPNELFQEHDVPYSVKSSKYGGGLSKNDIYQLLDNEKKSRSKIVSSLLSRRQNGGGAAAQSLIKISKDKRVNSKNIYKYFSKKELLEQLA